MLSLGLVTSSSIASEAIEQPAEEAGIFAFKGNWEPEVRSYEVIKTLRRHDPELMLLDLSDWGLVGPLVEHIRGTAGDGGPLARYLPLSETN